MLAYFSATDPSAYCVCYESRRHAFVKCYVTAILDSRVLQSQSLENFMAGEISEGKAEGKKCCIHS